MLPCYCCCSLSPLKKYTQDSMNYLIQIIYYKIGKFLNFLNHFFFVYLFFFWYTLSPKHVHSDFFLTNNCFLFANHNLELVENWRPTREHSGLSTVTLSEMALNTLSSFLIYKDYHKSTRKNFLWWSLQKITT